MAFSPPLRLPLALTTHIGYLGVLLGQRAQRDFEAAIAPLGLVPAQYDYLATLVEHGPQSQRALAKVLDVDPARIVALTDQLEHRGLVTRTTDPTDRRRNLVALTRKGTALTVRATREAEGVEAALTTGLTARERADLRRLLQRVAVRED
jgi:MarR family transcriptional regulator, lower aerobic nicotinate degradation pathway regulator